MEERAERQHGAARGREEVAHARQESPRLRDVLERIERSHDVEAVRGLPCMKVRTDEANAALESRAGGVLLRHSHEARQEIHAHDIGGAPPRELEGELPATAPHVEVSQARLDRQVARETVQHRGKLGDGLVAQQARAAGAVQLGLRLAVAVVGHRPQHPVIDALSEHGHLAGAADSHLRHPARAKSSARAGLRAS